MGGCNFQDTAVMLLPGSTCMPPPSIYYKHPINRIDICEQNPVYNLCVYDIWLASLK